MTQQDRYSTAVHEAGHAVVAWALKVKTRWMAIGTNGDDTAGNSRIDSNRHLPLVDRIAICSAGADAQAMFDVPSHDLGTIMDINAMEELLDDLPENEREIHRYAGYRRSKELLEFHRATVERLALELVERTELNQVEIEQILVAYDR
jgi:ATP-dependent Zn protease